MIDAHFSYTPFLSLSVRNHASPQVCASVSSIAYGLAGFCVNNKEKLKNLSYRLESGDYDISFESDDQFVRGAFQLAHITLLQVEKGYPDDIHVTCDV